MACGEVRADLDKPARGMSGEETSLHEPLSEMMVQVWKSKIFRLTRTFVNNDFDGITF